MFDDLVDTSLSFPNVAGRPLWMVSAEVINDTTREALTTLWERGRAMRSLAEFSRRYVDVVPARHHELICEGVDALLEDRYDVLVVMSPPASAKSTYVSVAAPAYMLGRDPTTRIISVSRAAELATEFGGRVKAIVEGEDFAKATGVAVASDTRAKDNWKTTEGGGYFAVGASGGVLGRRADVVICDDIHASFEDAQSETQLQKIRNWFESDLLSRLTPTGKLIVIGQRLNANDIIGFVMQRAAENPDIRLKVLKFTAICEDPEDDPLDRQKGERMWPEFYTDHYLADKRRDDYVWRTLWMQEPPSEDGSWVGAEHLKLVDITPSNMVFYLLSDLALSVNKGDYSVHITAGVHSDGMIYVEDAWRDRCAIEKTVEKHLELVDTYHPAESLIDDDNAAKVYVQLLATKARERGVAVPWKQMPMRGQDKETRAAPLRGLFRSGRVAFKRAAWNRWLINEIMMFPNAMGAGVDDGVDALSLIGRRLASLARPANAPAARPPMKTVQQATLNELFEDRERSTHIRRRI